MWRGRRGAISGRHVMAVVASVPPDFSLSNVTPLEPLLPALTQFFLYPTSLLASLPPAWPRVAASLWRNLGPTRHGRSCRLCPSFFSLQLHSPSACPPLGPMWRGRRGAISGRHVMAVVASVPPDFSLSNVTPLEPLLPALTQFFLYPTSLPLSLPPAWPRVAASLWRNLGPTRHGRSCRRSPSFVSLQLHFPSPCPPLGPVWRAPWRNLGPARHGRCCRRSPSFFSHQLHSPSPCPPLGSLWRPRCGATSGRHVVAVVAGVAPVFSLSNFTSLQFAPAWPRVAGSVWCNLRPARHGGCSRRSPSVSSLKRLSL